jgi:hypothetical protein
MLRHDTRTEISFTASLQRLEDDHGPHMFWEVARTYPWAFASTVVLPVVVAIGAVIAATFGSLGGFETLKGRLAAAQQSDRIEQGVNEARSNSSALQSTLRLLEFYNDKVSAAGKRDATLTALINQYQRLSQAAALFGQIRQRDPSLDQGKTAIEVLKILNQDIVRTAVRDDLPGKPLVMELEPNSFRVIFAVPMRVPPDLTFTNLPTGVTAHVSDKSEISFSVIFLPLSVPVKTFGLIASAEL